jgi:hypothetical protein
MHEFRVNFTSARFLNARPITRTAFSVQVMPAVASWKLSSFARITRIITAFADSVRPDPDALSRSMHEFRVNFSNARFLNRRPITRTSF